MFYFCFQAIKRDSSFVSKVKKIVVLGGSFFALGNVNPAAEANVSGQLLSVVYDAREIRILSQRLICFNLDLSIDVL